MSQNDNDGHNEKIESDADKTLDEKGIRIIDIEDVDDRSNDFFIVGASSHPDSVRKTVSYGLLGLISFLSISVLFANIFGFMCLDEAKDLSFTLIAPLIAVFGTAVGFYFGNASR